MNFLASAYESYGRGGSFIFHKLVQIQYVIEILKICGSKTYGGRSLAENNAETLPVAPTF